jgi:hypothetical protein
MSGTAGGSVTTWAGVGAGLVPAPTDWHCQGQGNYKSLQKVKIGR